jgi:hypothetical protein
MNAISKEDYLKLLEDLANDQYGYDEQPEDTHVPDEAWIPSESVAKEMIRMKNLHGKIDVTKFRKDKIQDALYKCMNIQVGDFLIKIESYHGHPDKFGKGVNLTMDIEVWEKRYQTPTGRPCNMDFRIDWSRDNRFFGRKWLDYFGGGTNSSGINVPVETVVEIVRWMQALKRMTAFL